MLVNKNAAFVHIARTGGTAIANAIRRVGECAYVGLVNNPADKIHKGANIYTPHMHPRKVCESVPLLNQCDFFTFVRNPWDRFVSWYESGDTEKTFSEFLHFTADKRDKRRAPGSYPICQSDYLDWNYKIVGRYESIEAHFLLVCSSFGIKGAKLKRDGASIRQRDYRKYYSDREIELVEMIETEVVNLGGYTFEGTK